jgi:hypothetical protein
MTPDLFMRLGLEPALDLLPPQMDTADARAFLIAIALQESRLIHRRQIGGPARGYFQFELAGVDAVLTHHRSGDLALRLCLDLDIGPTVPAVYQAIEFNDVVAAGFARLLIWTLPTSLPRRTEFAESYAQYLAAWNPGRPRPQTWEGNFLDAWAQVQPV